ncbi:antitoxin [Candidatus Poriferisodalis sp.]|uniref:antitoxin n=1 Tax=Candidatus Poriferisodalis sp. TaxID=3101277 RepID=UPI003AF789BC
MRTTLTLDDDVADAVRERARLLDQPFKRVVNEALRRGLGPAASVERPVYRVKPHRSALRAGVDPLRLNQLNDEIDAAASLGETGG